MTGSAPQGKDETRAGVRTCGNGPQMGNTRLAPFCVLRAVREVPNAHKH